MIRSSVVDILEEQPAKPERWKLGVGLALLLSLGLHLAFLWWAQGHAVNIFSDSYYDEIVPRTFKVDRVEIDSRLLDDGTTPEVSPRKKVSPAPIEIATEDIAGETAQIRTRPMRPGQLGLADEPIPEIGLATSAVSASTEAARAAALDEDINSIQEALLAEAPSAAAQPAIVLAAAAGNIGAAGDESAMPSGYSDLDELLSRSGGLTENAGPIFMPSDILFGYDEAHLRAEAMISLEKLGELIQGNPKFRFRIEGHTDSFGTTDYNNRLSQARAEAVREWLVQRMAINFERIDVLGLGSTRPLAPSGGTIEEQQLNRRVEIVILAGGDQG